LKNILSPAIDDLEYNISTTKNSGYIKLINVDNIKVETTLQISYVYPGGTGTNLHPAIYAQDMFIIVSNNENKFILYFNSFEK
jgi:hypothetical protein